MRKILMIVVLGLFLSENAYALKFYDCYVKKVKDKDVEAHLKERGVFGKYDNTKFEDSYFQIYKDGSAEQVIIKTDKWLKETSDWIDEEFKDASYATPKFLAQMKKKIEKFNYKVIFANEKYISLESTRALLGQKTKVNINLKNGEVTHIDREGLFATIKQCKIKTKKKGSYLDYWWALILIVAITFFVYTQSSSRLNKMNIRRK